MTRRTRLCSIHTSADYATAITTTHDKATGMDGESMPLFDAVESQRRADDGRDQAAGNRPTNLELARQVAEQIARSRVDRCVTADDVGAYLAAQHDIQTLGPAAGSIFRGDQWEWNGQFVKSTRTTNHSRLLRVWRLKG